MLKILIVDLEGIEAGPRWFPYGTFYRLAVGINPLSLLVSEIFSLKDADIATCIQTSTSTDNKESRISEMRMWE